MLLGKLWAVALSQVDSVVSRPSAGKEDATRLDSSQQPLLQDTFIVDTGTASGKVARLIYTTIC